MLRRQGFGVRSFPCGRLARAAAAQHPPDLILLDINMPEMNEYDVCRQLKADSRFSKIPVIFLSALDETGDKVKAVQAGGVDYIRKPFQLEEVHARVETQLDLHRLHQTLERHNEHLEEIVQARTRELADAHARLRILEEAKTDFLNLISHEFRTPLNGLLGIGELLLDDGILTPEMQELRQMFDESRRRIVAILEDALLPTQIEVEGKRFAAARLSLVSVLTAAVEQVAAFAQSRQIRLETARLRTAPIEAGRGGRVLEPASAG
jgi:two-component system, sensor histidine kinase and response regulator